MNFQVPQFIEIEDKVFGPLSFKQFLYLTGSTGLAFIAYVYLPIYIAIFPIIALVAFGVGLAFYQINNRPFIFTIQSAFKYFTSNKLYLWQKSTTNNTIVKTEKVNKGFYSTPKLSKSKLEDLSWSLDVNETLNKKDDYDIS